MRFLLDLFPIHIDSFDSLIQDRRDQLLESWSQIKGFTTITGINFFGKDKRLKAIKNADQVLTELRKGNRVFLIFSDAEHVMAHEARRELYFYRLGSYVKVKLTCDCRVEDFDTVVSETLALDKLLLTVARNGKAIRPFSSVVNLDSEFRPPRPPRRFGTILTNAIVDIIHLNSDFNPNEGEIVSKLREEDLIVGAQRIVNGDLVTIKWGDIRQESVQKILSQRYLWYAERGNLPVDSSFNSIGDKEFALLNATRTRELTAYSSFSKMGMKGVVFNRPEEIKEVLEELDRILTYGKTVEGYEIKAITLVTPSRESAIKLRPLAFQHGMRVAYAGEGNRLWEPFPPEYEGV